LDFFERELVYFAFAVRCSFDVCVVDDDKLVVLRLSHVKLDGVNAHFQGSLEAEQRVFRLISSCASVTNSQHDLLVAVQGLNAFGSCD